MTATIAIAVVVVAGLIGERIWHANLSKPLDEIEPDNSGPLWLLLLALAVVFVAALAMAGAGGVAL